jgi:glycosyl transferase family 87
MLPPLRKPYLPVATFFWVMLFGYFAMVPRVYDRMSRGYADFSNFYAAGKIVQARNGDRLYDLALQTKVQDQFSEASALNNRALPYMRPPFEAFLFLPLSYLSFPLAYVVWVLFCVALVGATAAYLRPRISGLATIPWWLYYPAYFSFYPIMYGFILGQDSPLMLLLFGLVAVQWLEGRDFLAGCFLGLALIKFQLVLPLVFILILKRQVRTLAGFSLVAALLAGVSLWAVGWHAMAAYPAYLWRLNAKGAAAAIYPSVMPSLRGLVQGWTDPLRPRPGLDWITAGLSVAVLIWAARQWHTEAARGSKTYWAGISIAFLATLLAGYHEFGYDLSLLLPVVLLAAGSIWEDRELDSSTRRILLCSTAALMFPPLYLLLMTGARLNLMAVAVLGLAWGLSRAIKSWAGGEAMAAPDVSVAI